ncbi:SIMPL domain-containing protein [Sphingomonas sabuli]|uniref:SIMPL domain-containing protein n=1 Tax=Sphingomonas sabuli TaxID=2764186 RepID=A0A7G9L2X9_9SPHN|nr:SIMPL domain-containing protein [Sphingomonas sabuli]QNM82978.1 SIMPL domain-containing protein [Sphingomonas sabuli]
MKKFMIAAVLAASPAVLHAQPQPEITVSPSGAVLSLSAEGESKRVPDIATFSAGVVTQDQTAAGALRANSIQMDRVIAALKQAGIADRDIQTSAISLNPRYSDPEREAQLRARQTGQPYIAPDDTARRIVGYDARNTVEVKVRELARMGRVIDTLAEVGANEINGPDFTLDEQDSALDEARASAVAKGRARAELYARASGLRVGRILSISESGGYYPVRQIMVTGSRVGGAAAPPPPPPPAPVAPGELSLGVNVSMQFELVR